MAATKSGEKTRKMCVLFLFVVVLFSRLCCALYLLVAFVEQTKTATKTKKTTHHTFLSSFFYQLNKLNKNFINLLFFIFAIVCNFFIVVFFFLFVWISKKGDAKRWLFDHCSFFSPHRFSSNSMSVAQYSNKILEFCVQLLTAVHRIPSFYRNTVKFFFHFFSKNPICKCSLGRLQKGHTGKNYIHKYLENFNFLICPFF